jgi:hypothetical protein
METEEREEALPRSAHAGEAGGSGKLLLALTARIDDDRFPDAA